MQHKYIVRAMAPRTGKRHVSGRYIQPYIHFFFLRAAPTAYGGSQARGQIGAVAASLHHSSWHRWIFNPLSKARD